MSLIRWGIIGPGNIANNFAGELNVTTQNIAGAWPLNQSFPSFALSRTKKNRRDRYQSSKP